VSFSALDRFVFDEMSITIATEAESINSDNEKKLPGSIPAPDRALDILFSPSSISIYVLRRTEPDNNWKLQAVFAEDLNFEFTQKQCFIQQEVSL
jgi:hypothetical protein